jgi:tetratricopeptide (TPR) repeat protein
MAERASVSSGAMPPAGRPGGSVDYYPIVAGAVAGLSDNSPQARQAVYARARRVVLGQLRASKPPLAKHQIDLERFALEEVIKKVEAEARAGGINASRTNKRAQPGASARTRRGRMLRVIAPFGLALVIAGIAGTYWLAGGRLSNLAFTRPRPQVAQAPPAKTGDTAGSQTAAANERGNTGEGAANEPKGCSPILAATDLVACANADAERIEASRERQVGLPWSSAYTNLRDVKPAPPQRQPAPPSGSKARDLTESGKLAAKDGDLDRAARDLTDAIRADPLYAEAHIHRGQTMFKLGDVEQAIADLNEGIKLDPHNAPAIRARGMSQLYKGDEDSAMADLSKAIQLAEADPARMPALDLFYAHRSRAALCEKKRLYDREIYDLTAMIDSYWKDPLLAEALRTSYREAGAASLMGSIYRLRANVHVRKGSPELAIADLSFALQLDQPRTLALLLERARLQELLGRREPAIVDFQRILEINPANTEAKTALTRLKGQASR